VAEGHGLDMLISFDETVKLIAEGDPLHIAGSESLLRQLPQGKWVGGSTEYFMSKKSGGIITNELLHVFRYPYNCTIKSYDADTIENVAVDGYENGFSIVIVPYDSEVHRIYARNAMGFDDMFIKNVIGWVSGVNLNVEGQVPITVNGETGEIFTDKSAVMHVEVPDDKSVGIDMINIFEQDDSSARISFLDDGFSASDCLVDGVVTNFAEYLAAKRIDTKLPLIGEYSGGFMNVSVKSVENGVVNFYAPVFKGIEYKTAKQVLN
jgi:hypothetical protein